MNEYVLSQENIQEYARKAWEIEKMLSFFEEILPEETNGLYKKYPKLKSILSIICTDVPGCVGDYLVKF